MYRNDTSNSLKWLKWLKLNQRNTVLHTENDNQNISNNNGNEMDGEDPNNQQT